ncbi:PhlD [Streptomyces sp. NPDC048111]|uniref:PhlD n=1 Tax=Streptomyces sp. NPDC048111 TaxID=3365500 RepID=UPI00371A1F0B
MPVRIAPPCVVLPGNVVTTDEICADIRRVHAGLPGLEAMLRAARATTVGTRHFTRPLHAPTVAGNARSGERNDAAYEDALALAAEAGRRALAVARLRPEDIDAVVTSHTTSWAVPSLDVHLVGELGLRPDVRRHPLGRAGCAGGAQGVVRAHQDIAAHPGANVLLITAECMSATTYDHADTSPASMVRKALFGDGAAATVICERPAWDGPGFVVEDTFEYVLPDGAGPRPDRTGGAGPHTGAAPAAAGVGDWLPALRTWLDGRPLDFAVVHPGGPDVLDGVAADLGLADRADGGGLRHARESLAANGDLGGPAVLDVLARMCAEPPLPGAAGLIVAFGPGFVLAAARGHWSG